MSCFKYVRIDALGTHVRWRHAHTLTLRVSEGCDQQNLCTFEVPSNESGQAGQFQQAQEEIRCCFVSRFGDVSPVCSCDGVVFAEMCSLERLIKWKQIERATCCSVTGQVQRGGVGEMVWQGVKKNAIYRTIKLSRVTLFFNLQLIQFAFLVITSEQKKFIWNQ